MHPVPSMHAGIPFAELHTKQMLEGSPLVDIHLPFRAPAVPSCSCALMLEAPAFSREKGTKGKAFSRSHGARPSFEPGKEGIPGAACLQAEATAPIAGCSEGGRQLWASPHPSAPEFELLPGEMPSSGEDRAPSYIHIPPPLLPRPLPPL